jgi:hypothetical protein
MLDNMPRQNSQHEALLEFVRHRSISHFCLDLQEELIAAISLDQIIEVEPKLPSVKGQSLIPACSVVIAHPACHGHKVPFLKRNSRRQRLPRRFERPLDSPDAFAGRDIEVGRNHDLLSTFNTRHYDITHGALPLDKGSDRYLGTSVRLMPAQSAQLSGCKWLS